MQIEAAAVRYFVTDPKSHRGAFEGEGKRQAYLGAFYGLAGAMQGLHRQDKLQREPTSCLGTIRP